MRQAPVLYASYAGYAGSAAPADETAQKKNVAVFRVQEIFNSGRQPGTVEPSENNIVFKYKDVPGTGIHTHFEAGLVGFKDPLFTVGGVRPNDMESHFPVQPDAGELVACTGLPIRPAFQ